MPGGSNILVNCSLPKSWHVLTEIPTAGPHVACKILLSLTAMFPGLIAQGSCELGSTLEAGRHFQKPRALLSARAWSLPAASLAEQGAQEQQRHVLHSPGCLWTMTCHFWSHLLSSIWGLIVPRQEAGAYFSSQSISRAFGDGRHREIRDRNFMFLHQGWCSGLQKEKERWQNKDTPFTNHWTNSLSLLICFCENQLCPKVSDNSNKPTLNEPSWGQGLICWFPSASCRFLRDVFFYNVCLMLFFFLCA